MTIREAVIRDLLPLLQRHVQPDKWDSYIRYYCETLRAWGQHDSAVH